jgi:hypothetical protein
MTGPRRQLRMIAHESLHRLDFAVEHLAGAWSLRNACVVYQAHGRQLSAQFVSFEGRTAHILAFSEYRFSFVRVSNVRAARSSERERYRHRCAARSLGIAAPLLQNNLFHALYHAVPLHSDTIGRSALVEAATFIPLLAHKARMLPNLTSSFEWRAWELTLRALTARTASQIAADVRNLLRNECTCFDLVLGSTGAFGPAASNAAPAIRAFRDAAVAHARVSLGQFGQFGSSQGARVSLGQFGQFGSSQGARVSLGQFGQFGSSQGARVSLGSALPAAWAPRLSSRSPPFVFICRSQTRVLVNQDELVGFLGPEVVQSVQIESLPLSQQLTLIAGASGMVGAHGQAMALLVFLPADSRPTAVIEVLPPPPETESGLQVKPPYWQLYLSLSHAMGITHVQFSAALAPPCSRFTHVVNKALAPPDRMLRCNLSLVGHTRREFLRKVRRLHASTASLS